MGGFFYKEKYVLAIPPGATILEQLETRDMSLDEFTLKMGLSKQEIDHLVRGQMELTEDIAVKLESVLGIPATYWSNLEMLYREALKKGN